MVDVIEAACLSLSEHSRPFEFYRKYGLDVEVLTEPVALGGRAGADRSLADSLGYVQVMMGRHRHLMTAQKYFHWSQDEQAALTENKSRDGGRLSFGIDSLVAVAAHGLSLRPNLPRQLGD
jgi:hypothetical protein